MALKLKDGSWSELLKHLAIFKAVFLAEISRNIEPIFVLLLYPCTAPAPSNGGAPGKWWCATTLESYAGKSS